MNVRSGYPIPFTFMSSSNTHMTSAIGNLVISCGYLIASVAKFSEAGGKQLPPPAHVVAIRLLVQRAGPDLAKHGIYERSSSSPCFPFPSKMSMT